MVIPQWSYCSCTLTISKINQSLCSHCRSFSEICLSQHPALKALGLLSKDCPWHIPPEIATVSARLFNLCLTSLLFSLRKLLVKLFVSKGKCFPNSQVFAMRHWCTVEMTTVKILHMFIGKYFFSVRSTSGFSENLRVNQSTVSFAVNFSISYSWTVLNKLINVNIPCIQYWHPNMLTIWLKTSVAQIFQQSLLLRLYYFPLLEINYSMNHSVLSK